MALLLWFGVGIKRYTTRLNYLKPGARCGLVQESKDIQPVAQKRQRLVGCGLVQESKDIQRVMAKYTKEMVVVWCRNQKIYNVLCIAAAIAMLWFGVGIKRYTTRQCNSRRRWCCGLVQESKDIQRIIIRCVCILVVVWCRNQKIYNLQQ